MLCGCITAMLGVMSASMPLVLNPKSNNATLFKLVLLDAPVVDELVLIPRVHICIR